MTRNTILTYNPKLKKLARILRKKSTLGEVLLWLELKNKTLGYEFHRQVPIADYITDFYCHELMIAIEIDGSSHDHKYDYDLSREKVLESYGVVVIRFDEYEVRKQMWNVIKVIEKAISDREKHPPSPLQRGS